MIQLNNIWKDHSIPLDLKTKILKCLVWPVMLYGCESWTQRKEDDRKIEAAEMWFLRRLLESAGQIEELMKVYCTNWQQQESFYRRYIQENWDMQVMQWETKWQTSWKPSSREKSRRNEKEVDHQLHSLAISLERATWKYMKLAELARIETDGGELLCQRHWMQRLTSQTVTPTGETGETSSII